MFNLGSFIYYFDESLTEIGQGIDPKLHGDYISFIKDGNIHVYTISDKSTTQLTNSAGQETSGLAEFIIQEEFDRYTGYWWHDNKILYQINDSSAVSSIYISRHDSVEEFKYPKFGSKNVAVSLGIVDLNGNIGCFDVKSVIDWCEYIVRAGWINKDLFVLFVI